MAAAAWSAAGRPYQNYVTWNVTASQSGGWTANSWTNSAPASPALGLSGFTQTARAAGETIGLAADAPEHEFDRLVLCALAQPGGGTITVRVGGEERRWSLDAPRRLPACHAVDSAAPVASASVTTEDAGMVTITSLATFRRGGGAVLSNLGVIGAQLAHFGRSDEGVLRAELAAYRPDLIILAFGTNEGFDRRVSARDYEAGLRAQIARIRRLAGANVPILLVGAPDAATRDPAAAGGDCGEGYYTPALLGEIRARQRAVARDLGLAFWDWEAAMGGRCAARAWHARRPDARRPYPLHPRRRRPDRPHAVRRPHARRRNPRSRPPLKRLGAHGKIRSRGGARLLPRSGDSNIVSAGGGHGSFDPKSGPCLVDEGAGARPMNKVLFGLDRTLVLFIGIAVGAVVGISFFTGGEPSPGTQATAPVQTAAAPAPNTVGAAQGQATDAPASRLASAIAENRKIHIGVFGDSFGDGVWAGLYNILRSDDGFEVHQFSERSTGFTRYRSLNLLDDIRAKLDRQPVDIAIISFGANDTQGIYLDGHGNTFMSEGWQRIVTERVTAVVDLLARARRPGLLGRPAEDARGRVRRRHPRG